MTTYKSSQMQTTKYQIFISSTYEDLKDARDQVIKAALEMGHIPVGMEMFSAADEEQWKIITRQIDQSDYYVVIMAHRYGSVVDGISYTEKEYNYAIQQGIPVIGFIIDNAAAWPADRMEIDKKKNKALDQFKTKVKQKPVGFWSSPDELHGKFSIALMKLINTNPRPGWIRTSEVAGPEVLTELSRLSSENAYLRKKLAEIEQRPISHFAQGDDLVEVPYTYRYGETPIRETFQTTWNDLFQVIGQEILRDSIQYNIENMVRKILRNDMALKNISQRSDSLPVVNEGFEKIKIQFIALNLIEIQFMSIGTRNTNQPHWILTDYGKQVLADLLAIRRTTKAQEDVTEP
jgi:hypothetical protein